MQTSITKAVAAAALTAASLRLARAAEAALMGRLLDAHGDAQAIDDDVADRTWLQVANYAACREAAGTPSGDPRGGGSARLQRAG